MYKYPRSDTQRCVNASLFALGYWFVKHENGIDTRWDDEQKGSNEESSKVDNAHNVKVNRSTQNNFIP